MNFLDKILAYCREHHISASQFEREAGLSGGSISKWKHKGFDPSYRSQQKIAAYMNISVDDLMRIIPDEAVSFSGAGADIVRQASVKYIPVLNSLPGDKPLDPQMVRSYLPAMPESFADSDRCFAMEMPDSSMSPEYCAGDIIIVLRCDDPASGDIVVVSSPGEPVLCRKLIREDDGIILQPFSRHYDAVSYRYEEMDMLPVVFSGKVIGIFRTVQSFSESVTE